MVPIDEVQYVSPGKLTVVTSAEKRRFVYGDIMILCPSIAGRTPAFCNSSGLEYYPTYQPGTESDDERRRVIEEQSSFQHVPLMQGTGGSLHVWLFDGLIHSLDRPRIRRLRSGSTLPRSHDTLQNRVAHKQVTMSPDLQFSAISAKRVFVSFQPDNYDKISRVHVER
jgi:hypothetical protein